MSRLYTISSTLLWEVVALAIVAYVAGYLMIVAYRKAQPQYLAPIEFTGLIWAAIASALVFDQPASWSTWLGGSIIMFACLYSSIQRKFINRRKTKMPSSKPF